MEGYDTVRLRCPVHGLIGPASLGATLFCVGCKRWIDTLTQPANAREPTASLARWQNEMKRRLLRKMRRTKK